MQKIIAGIILAFVVNCGFGAEVKLQNPSFEQGTGGYWINKPALAQIDAETSSQGRQSLCLQATAQGRVSMVQFIICRPGETYRFAFDAKGDSDAKVQVKFMLQGKKPIAFWLPSGKKQSDFEFSPSTGWSRHEFVFGPVPELLMGQEVNRIGIYIDVCVGEKNGQVWLDNLEANGVAGELPVSSAAPAAIPARDDKTKPTPKPTPKTAIEVKKAEPSIKFELPAPVQIYEQPVKVGIVASAAAENSTVSVKVTDCRGVTVMEKKTVGNTVNNVEFSQPGYYRLEAVLERQGGVPESRSTSLMITTPLPSDYYSTPEPAFGVWGGLSPELLRLGGAKWTRELFFTIFQKKDFEAKAPTEEQLKQRSPVKVIKCLNVLSPFKKMVPVPEADWPELREKVTKELVSRRGLVDVWETQNEPMVGENFHGSMNDVVDIIGNTSALVRKYSPGTPLAGICINPMSLNQYGQITGYYRNHKMTSLVDAVMLHPYIPNASSPDTADYIETLSRLERDLRGITGTEVPLYISEIGYSTKPGGEVTELQQAAYLARVVLLNRRVKSLRACVWHIGLWNEATSPRELDYGILRGHPKGSPVREPKPAFAAWATVSRQTYNAEYLGDMEFGRGVKVMLFSRLGKPLLVAYSLSGRTQQLKIPLGGSQATVTDVCGTVSSKTLEKGMIDLAVDEAPVYIAGNDSDDLRRLAGLKVEFSPEILSARPGSKMTAMINGSPLARVGSLLKVETPAGWTTKVDGSGARREVTINVPAGAQPGEVALFFHLMENGESRNIWRREFQVLPPVELQDIKVQPAASGGMELTFSTVGEANSQPLQMKVCEDGRVMATATVGINHPAKIVLPPPAFGRPHQYTAELIQGKNYSWQVPLPALNRFPVASVDAALSPAAWPSVASFDLAAGQYSRHSISGDADRPEGKLYLGWNKDSLLLRLVCRDRKHITSGQVDNMWNGDSLQIGFSIPREEMIRPNNDGIQETAYAEFGIMPDAAGQCRSLVWASTNRNMSELGKPLPGTKAVWQREGDVITYRIDIPWQTLNVKNPRVGMPIKFSLLINDCDNVEGKQYQRQWLEWYSGIADGKNPALYGDGILTK